MSQQLRVLVVGASIAGPMTAYWLAKAGARVTVIERWDKLRPGGQAIDIRNTGVTIMNRIPGMEALVRAKNPGLEGLSMRKENGDAWLTFGTSGNASEQSLLSEYEIFRGDLAEILYNYTTDDENVDYVFGEQIASIDKHTATTITTTEDSPSSAEDGLVTVHFQNGHPSAEYDLVVACDGATSRTRALGFDIAPREGVNPVGCWGAYFSTPRDLLNGSKLGHGYSAVGGRFLAIGTKPTGGCLVTIMANYAGHKGDPTAPFREANKQGETALMDFIENHYRGAGWKTEEVMAAMRESTDLYASDWAQVKLPMMQKGRFATVGDAGYAPGPTGLGTTLAMTGAYVLAGEVAVAHKGNLKAGLEAYEERMRPIVADMQKVPPGVFAFMAPQTSWGLWVRNHVFGIIDATGVVNLAQKLTLGSAAAKDKYGLPDYWSLDAKKAA